MLDGPQGWVQTSSRTDMNNLNRMFLLTPKDLNFMLTEKNCKANGRPNPKITFRIGDTDIKKLPFSVTSDYNSMKIQASVWKFVMGLVTLSLRILMLNSQCKEGASDGLPLYLSSQIFKKVENISPIKVHCHQSRRFCNLRSKADKFKHSNNNNDYNIHNDDNYDGKAVG